MIIGEPRPLYQWSKGAFFDDNEANLFLRYCERYQNCDSDEIISCEKYKALKRKFESYCLETGNYGITSFLSVKIFTKINLDFYMVYDYIFKIEIDKNKSNPKKVNKMSKKNFDLGEQFKSLRQWAEELLNNDDFTRFLDFCKWEKKPTEMISYTEFLTLKEKFEA